MANKRTAKRKPNNEAFTPEQVIDVLRQTSGMIYTAARILKCSARTIYNYRDRYPEVAAAIEEERGVMGDTAELALKRAIVAGEAWAVCFYLKTQGKDRGYVERQEISGKDGGAIPLAIVKMPIDEL